MKQNVALARSLGVLNVPDQSRVAIAEIDRLDPGEVCIMSTGSQGEPRSALAGDNQEGVVDAYSQAHPGSQEGGHAGHGGHQPDSPPAIRSGHCRWGHPPRSPTRRLQRGHAANASW